MAPRTKGKSEVQKLAQKLETLTVEYVPVGSIQPNSYNPNRQSEHDYQLLLASMREDGFTQPIVVIPDPDRPGAYIIVDGEHRWRAGQDLGYTEVPVVVAPMTPEQAKIATLRHNRARGSEDVELTAQLMRDLRELGALEWAQDSLMLADEELSMLLDDVAAPDALANEDYSGAWVPSARDFTTQSNYHGDQAEGTTAKAQERLREREDRIAKARTDEERVQVNKELAVYRVHLVFTGDEGEIVKRVLGDNAADTLLELCKREDSYRQDDARRQERENAQGTEAA